MKVTVTVTGTAMGTITTSCLAMRRARTSAQRIMRSDGDGCVGRRDCARHTASCEAVIRDRS